MSLITKGTPRATASIFIETDTTAPARPNPIDEQALVERAQTDPSAFEQLYAIYAHSVYAYILGAIKDEDEAQDITQDVFIKAVQSLQNGKFTWTEGNDDSFQNWLFVSAANRIHDHQRRDTSQWRLGQNLTARAKTETRVGAFEQPEMHLLKTEQDAELRKAVMQLKPVQGQTIALRYWSDRSNEEIAAIMGLNPNTVQSHINRGQQILRRVLQAQRDKEKEGDHHASITDTPSGGNETQH